MAANDIHHSRRARRALLTRNHADYSAEGEGDGEGGGTAIWSQERKSPVDSAVRSRDSYNVS